MLIVFVSHTIGIVCHGSNVELHFAGTPRRRFDYLSFGTTHHQIRDVLFAQLPQTQIRRRQARIDLDGVIDAVIAEHEINADVATQA